MKMGFVFEVEARWFAIEDIRPRHKERSACQIGGHSIILGDVTGRRNAELCIRDSLARLTLGNEAKTVTRWRNRHEVDFGIAAL